MHGVYGMQAVRLDPGLEGVKVTYDATRLKLDDVERQLRMAGLAVERAGGC